MLGVQHKALINNLMSNVFTTESTEFAELILSWPPPFSSPGSFDASERIQKAALSVILKGRYQNYSDALKTLGIKSLENRREELCLKFAKSCLRIEKFRKFFPLKKKEHCMIMRESEKFALQKYGSVRYRDSAIPYMKRVSVGAKKITQFTICTNES